MNYDEYLMHFNPNHDPRNGQFAKKVGGVASSAKTYLTNKRHAREERRAADEAEKNQNARDFHKLDADWRSKRESASELQKRVNSAYEALGKTPIDRLIAAMKNKTPDAKRYNELRSEASKARDERDTAYRDSVEAYVRSGNNFIERIIRVSTRK